MATRTRVRAATPSKRFRAARWQTRASRPADGASTGTAHWTAASVAGTELLGAAADGWTGPLAGLGSVIDAVNAQLCPAGDPVVPGVEVPGVATFVCVQVLPHR